MVTAVVAVLLRRTSGALLLVLWKVSPIICIVPKGTHADFRSDGQQMGDAVPAGAGAQVTMHCKSRISALSKAYLTNMLVDKYNDSTKKYDQTVSLDGKVVSRLSSGKLLQSIPSTIGHS